MSIACVKIYLDEGVPEYMNGIFRIGNVISQDEKGNESHHEDLVDNLEFRSIDVLKQHVRAFKILCQPNWLEFNYMRSIAPQVPAFKVNR